MSAKAAARGVLARADRVMNRWYSWRFNPLYHSGALTVALLAGLILTGVYLLLFYRIGAPYASVLRLTDQAWAGRWVRSLHRFASDAAVVAASVHALRLFLQGRSWGPRTLAWISGLLLLGLIFVCGWTGYVMVWDIQGLVLAREGARLLDALPLFSEPMSRGFVGERLIPAAFFFLNLFLHIALPIGLGILLWLHVSRVARPALLPPRGVMWGVGGSLLLLSLLWPIGMAPPADLLRTPGRAPFDAFFAFWLPVSRKLPAWTVWIAGAVTFIGLLLVPLWTRPSAKARPPASFVDERRCTGCEQCYVDCPYEAISMIPRHDGRAGLVANVDPALCVSCGICSGSCAPMGVGPPGRTGLDQLSAIRKFVERQSGRLDGVVLAGCTRSGIGPGSDDDEIDNAPVVRVSCAGNLHTSVIEYLIRSGARGVLVVSCPPRDCWNREGPKWLEQRLFHDREAELQERVDRRRVRLIYSASGERAALVAALGQFRSDLEELERVKAEQAVDVERECDPVLPVVQS
jgi:coenzyme F420-reducing hydrogenase delta subunit/Pyruvate/2-oxoacid:ferredoxin oxidoreductase delta subunit